jgi:hypothetical protein
MIPAKPLPKPRPKFRFPFQKPQRLPKGYTVTLCAAILCEQGNRIAMAVDTKISDETLSADTPAMKFVDVRNWTLLFSGPMGDGLAITRAFKERVEGLEHESANAVISIADAVFHERINYLSSYPVLLPFNLTYEKFEREGQQIFPTEYHAEMLRQIDINSRAVNIQLLLCGWGQYEPTLCTIDTVNGVTPREKEGFAAIGSGGAIANTLLMYYAQSSLNSVHPDMSWPNALLSVCAAKFFAERAEGVGRHSWVRIVSRQQDPVWMTSDEIAEIKQWWNKWAAPATPANDKQDWIREKIGSRVK